MNLNDSLPVNLIQKIQNFAKVGYIFRNPESQNLECCDVVLNIFGIAKETIQENLDEIIIKSIHPVDKPLLNPDSFSFEPLDLKIIRPDGEIRYLRADENFMPVLIGKIDIPSVIQDITERKLAKKELQESTKRYKTIFNSTSVPIWEANIDELMNFINFLKSDGIINFKEHFENNPQLITEALQLIKITDVNEATYKLYGSKSKEDLFGTIDKVIPPEAFIDFFNLLVYITEGETEIEFQTVHQKFNGTRIHVLQKIAIVEKEDSGGYIMLVSVMDISQRVIHEIEKEKLLRQITSKNKDLEQIIFVTSHDLRSPLLNINGFSTEMIAISNDAIKVISETNDLDKLKRKMTAIMQDDIIYSAGCIKSSGDKMDKLLAGLLKLSRLGRAAIDKVFIDVNKMIANIIETFQYRINESEIGLKIYDLQACVGDEVQINQLFSNLIDNSIKYKHPDRQLVIKIYCFIERSVNIYCIEDNGIGIPENQLSSIFEIFHRVNPTSSIIGEGIGLSIVKGIVSRNGGRIWVESSENEWTKFFIALPNRLDE